MTNKDYVDNETLFREAAEIRKAIEAELHAKARNQKVGVVNAGTAKKKLSPKLVKAAIQAVD